MTPEQKINIVEEKNKIIADLENLIIQLNIIEANNEQIISVSDKTLQSLKNIIIGASNIPIGAALSNADNDIQTFYIKGFLLHFVPIKNKS